MACWYLKTTEAARFLYKTVLNKSWHLNTNATLNRVKNISAAISSILDQLIFKGPFFIISKINQTRIVVLLLQNIVIVIWLILAMGGIQYVYSVRYTHTPISFNQVNILIKLLASPDNWYTPLTSPSHLYASIVIEIVVL